MPSRNVSFQGGHAFYPFVSHNTGLPRFVHGLAFLKREQFEDMVADRFSITCSSEFWDQQLRDEQQDLSNFLSNAANFGGSILADEENIHVQTEQLIRACPDRANALVSVKELCSGLDC